MSFLYDIYNHYNHKKNLFRLKNISYHIDWFAHIKDRNLHKSQDILSDLCRSVHIFENKDHGLFDIRKLVSTYSQNVIDACEHRDDVSLAQIVLLNRMEGYKLDKYKGNNEIVQNELWRHIYLFGVDKEHTPIPCDQCLDDFVYFEYHDRVVESIRNALYGALMITRYRINYDEAKDLEVWNELKNYELNEEKNPHLHKIIDILKNRWNYATVSQILKGELSLVHTPTSACKVIQRYWRKVISNPEYQICKNRLMREFAE